LGLAHVLVAGDDTMAEVFPLASAV